MEKEYFYISFMEQWGKSTTDFKSQKGEQITNSAL